MLSASILLGSALGTPVLAENTTSDNTQITYTVDESYDWTAPASITFESNSNGSVSETGNVTVTNSVIGYGKKLVISISDMQHFELNGTDRNPNIRHYSVSNSSDVLLAGDEVLSVPYIDNTADEELTFTLNEETSEIADTYSGTLQFIATIESITIPETMEIDFGTGGSNGYYVGCTYGSLQPLYGFYATDYVTINKYYNKMKMVATAEYEGDGLAIYDKNYTFITGYGLSKAVNGYWDIEIPENAKYFRVSKQSKSFSGYYYNDNSSAELP